jgi:ABC-type nickel/cobalt efflux system permease component RcnA
MKIMTARLLALLGLVVAAAPLHAHPVPRRTYDRIIHVRLEPEHVIVDYQLEIDTFTVVYDELPAVDDQVDVSRLNKPAEFYEAFVRVYGEKIFPKNLTVTVDGKELTFRCTKHVFRLTDEDGKPLDHLRCNFIFAASYPPREGTQHAFVFREDNYYGETGMVRLSLAARAPIELLETSVPDKALQERPAKELTASQAAKLRKASATFRGLVSTAANPSTPEPKAESPSIAENPAVEPDSSADDADHGLAGLLFDTRRGLWLMLLIAGGFGAVHALQPGHGKTLVAAYLVGERGTVWHALLLGVSTTLAHTGVVIAAAVMMAIYGRDISRGLELVSALIVTVLGFGLLLQRLSGGADHFHFGGHSHGHGGWHSHGHGADHHHDDTGPVGTWGVIALGLAGGMVPCVDAIILLGFAAGKGLIWLALPLVLAFSAGLAATLVAVGIAVVYIKGFSESRWGQGKVIRALPLVSAAVILGMGLWMCYRSVHAA